MTSATHIQQSGSARREIVLRPGIPLALSAEPSSLEPFDDSGAALLVVCDGARGLSIPNEIFAVFGQQLEALIELARTPSAKRSTSPLQLLQQITAAANQRVHEQAHSRIFGPQQVGITALLLMNERAYITNVGSSEIYIVRNNRVRAILEANRSLQTVYIGEQLELQQLSTTGRPDHFHSATVDLSIDDRLVLCADGLAQHLAAGGIASVQQRTAELGARALRYDNPAQTALIVSGDYQASTAQVIWQSLRASAPDGRLQPAALQGGALVLICADAEQISNTKYQQRRLQSARFVFTFLALLIIVSGILAGTARVSAIYHAATNATQTAAALSADLETQQANTTATTPSATGLAVVMLTAQPTLPGITVTPRPSRTPTATRIPTPVFTPSPPPSATPTVTPSPSVTPCLLTTPPPNTLCAGLPPSN